MGQSPLAFLAANAAGANKPGFVDAQSALGMGQLHGKYYESSYAGRMFSCANQTGAAISAGLATTYTGLILSNPLASGKNLVVQRIHAVIGVAPAAVETLGLIVPTTLANITHTTPLTVLSTKLGAVVTASVAKVDAAATIATPVWYDWLQSSNLSASLLSFNYDAEGAIVVQPGGYVAIGSVAASSALALFGSFEWEELPI